MLLTSLALIFLVGLLLSSMMKKLKLPDLLGMLLTGMLLGPYALNLLDPNILLISPDLRTMALVIILLRAGLSLDLESLKKSRASCTFNVFYSCYFGINRDLTICPPSSFIFHFSRQLY